MNKETVERSPQASRNLKQAAAQLTAVAHQLNQLAVEEVAPASSDWKQQTLHSYVQQLQGIVDSLVLGDRMDCCQKSKSHFCHAHEFVTDILESITDGLLALNQNWQFTYLNAQAAMILQRSREELLEQNVWEQFPQAIGSRFYDEYHRVLRDRVSVAFEEFYKPLDTWFEVRAYPTEEGLIAYFQNITERKRLEAELQQLNQELELRVQQRTQELLNSQTALQQQTDILQTVLDNISDGVIVAASDGTLLFVNPAAQEMAGVKTTDSIANKNSDEYGVFLADGITLQAVDEFPISRSIRGEPVDCAEILTRNSRHPDGLWLEVSSRPLCDRNGTIFGGVSIGRNITERKRTEAALHQRQQEFIALMDHAPDVITRFSPDLRYLYVNPAIEKVTELPPQAFLGKTNRELGMPEALVQQWETSLRSVFLTGQERTIEFQFPGKDGFHDYQARLVPEFAPDRTVASVLTISRDISTLKRTENALRESESRFQAILDHSPVAIYLKDQEGRYIIVNHVSEVLTQLSRDNVLGKTDYELLPFGIADAFRKNDLQVIERQTTLEFEEIVPFGGGERIYLTVKFPLFNTEGNLYAVCGISTDITDRKQAEWATQTALQQKELLLREIHHRIKNNLQVISSLLMLQSNTVRDPRTVKLFEESQERVLAIALIHEQLYQSDHLQQINFARYVRDLVDQIFASHQPSHASVRLQVDIEPIALNLETALPCGLLIHELVSNALKHAFPQCNSPNTTASAQADDPIVKIQLRAEGKQYFLSVEDNGRGLPAQFDLKQTASLGLRLVRDLVKQLKGTLILHNRVGASFKVTFVELQYSGRF